MTVSRRHLLVGSAASVLAGAGGVLLTASPAVAATSMVVYNCASLFVRSGPGTSYPLVGSLPLGTVISGSAVGSWFKIASGPHAGRYCSGSYLTPSASTPVTNAAYVTAITRVTGGVPLRSGWAGTRVHLTQKRLGMERFGSDQTYDATTRRAVIDFQRSRRLTADGVVGPATWKALSTGWSFTSDAYQVQPQLPLSASARERTEKLVQYALAQRGSRYTWGGAGPYALGFDCSGLVLQAMYAAGRDPQPISVIKHAEPTYRTSRQLYAHPGLKSVAVAQRRRGDLIFYTNSSGAVHHVAIDLGDGTMMEAYGRIAAIRRVRSQYGSSYLAPYVKRAFA